MRQRQQVSAVFFSYFQLLMLCSNANSKKNLKNFFVPFSSLFFKIFFIFNSLNCFVHLLTVIVSFLQLSTVMFSYRIQLYIAKISNFFITFINSFHLCITVVFSFIQNKTVIFSFLQISSLLKVACFSENRR